MVVLMDCPDPSGNGLSRMAQQADMEKTI